MKKCIICDKHFNESEIEKMDGVIHFGDEHKEIKGVSFDICKECNEEIKSGEVTMFSMSDNEGTNNYSESKFDPIYGGKINIEEKYKG